MMIIVFLGPPGAGKGTQAKLLTQTLSLAHLSTGDMLRIAIESKTPLGLQVKERMGRGLLVSDDLMLELLAVRVQQVDCKNGFILDGFPRTMPQAQGFDQFLESLGQSISRVALFEMPEQSIVQRLTGRRTCKSCQAMFHIDLAPPKKLNVCDNCDSALVQREDDLSQVVLKRLRVYHEQTQPLVGFYESQAKLVRIKADESQDEVHKRLMECLAWCQ